jgi:hypothetical protein
MRAVGISLVVAATLFATSAYCADFKGYWTPNGSKCTQVEDISAIYGVGDMVGFDEKSAVGPEWGAEIKKVTKSGDAYTLKLYEQASEMNGPASNSTMHIRLSKSGKVANIDGDVYTRCK